MPLTTLPGRQVYKIPDSLTHSSGVITAIMNGVTYTISVGSPAANTLFFLYLLNGVLTQSMTIPSTYRNSNVGAILIGAYYSNGISTPAWGYFVNIVGTPRSAPMAYAMTIGATTTPPTKGGSVIELATWSLDGSKIHVRYDYQQGSAGSNGSGLYKFPLPSGFSVNTSVYTNVGNQIVPNVGFAEANNSSPSNGTGYVSLVDASNMCLEVTNGGSASVAGVSASNYALGFAGSTTYSFKAEIEAAGLSNVPLTDL